LSINVLVVLILIGGWLWGKVFTRLGLPSVLGMTLWGIALSVWGGSGFPSVIWEIAPFLKSLALIIILLRAGLGISKKTLSKVGGQALMMAFVPCLLEGTSLMLLFHYFMRFPWASAGMTGFLIAAVSPAVVVPSMLDLKERGFGKKNDVPTMILAGASLDDVLAITLFSIFLGLGQGESVSMVKTILTLPLSLIGGIIPGVIVGLFLAWYFEKRHKAIRATEKTLLMIGISVLLLQVGDWIHTAALLGIMTSGFILLEKCEPAARELAQKFNKAWVFAEIILFVLIGMSVDVSVALSAGGKGLIIIAIGLVFRSIGVLTALAFSGLSFKEKLFSTVAYLPKATVQAAMGSVPLAAGIAEGEMILAYAVLAIIFTAPLGLIGIRFLGPRLLDIDFPGIDEPVEQSTVKF